MSSCIRCGCRRGEERSDALPGGPACSGWWTRNDPALSGLERHGAAATRGKGSHGRGDGRCGQPVLGACRRAGRKGIAGTRPGTGLQRRWGPRARISSLTSGATEAGRAGMRGQGLTCAAVEHEAVAAWCDVSAAGGPYRGGFGGTKPERMALQTGEFRDRGGTEPAVRIGGVRPDTGPSASCRCPSTGSVVRWAWFRRTSWGGPKACGALVLRQGMDLTAQLRGRRAGNGAARGYRKT